MEECAPQNGWFFIYFVTFNSALVYSVIYNHIGDATVWRTTAARPPWMPYAPQTPSYATVGGGSAQDKQTPQKTRREYVGPVLSHPGGWGDALVGAPFRVRAIHLTWSHRLQDIPYTRAGEPCPDGDWTRQNVAHTSPFILCPSWLLLYV